jgi:hypothetical protein
MDLQRLFTLPGYSWRRKGHEGVKDGVDGVYLAFDYICLHFTRARLSPPTALVYHARPPSPQHLVHQHEQTAPQQTTSSRPSSIACNVPGVSRGRIPITVRRKESSKSVSHGREVVVELGVQMGTSGCVLHPVRLPVSRPYPEAPFSEVCRLTSFVIASPGFTLGSRLE